MSKKYILNKLNSVLTLQNAKLQTLIRLQPNQCSFQAFDEEELLSSPYIYKTYVGGYIDLLDERVEVIKKSNAKDYGQKYKIGTKAFLNDKNNLDIVVESYNPGNHLYKVLLVKTGGTLTVQESAISLVKCKGDSINVGIDENGDLMEQPANQDLSLPQEPEQVQIVRTQDQTVNKATNAKQLIDDQSKIAEEIANQKVDIVYQNEEDQKPVEDEETFIVKSANGKFAKEVSASQMVENTKEAITESLQKVVDSTRVATPVQEKEDFNEEAFVKLSPEMQKYISSFMAKDSRGRKMIITRLKDVEKLTAIASCADELSVKAAKAKIAKLQGK